MKLKFAVLFLGWLTTSGFGAWAASPTLTVAVYDFKGEAEAAGYASKVTALITADLAANTNLVMLERAELKKALGEQSFNLSGMVNSDTAARIGQVTGVKILVSGQVMMLNQNRVTILANIIGTETGRLFAAKVEGTENNLSELASELGSKIAETIVNQATNLIMEPGESSAARIERIVKSVTGTNRPTVSAVFHGTRGPLDSHNTANIEMGMILQKAGFVVVDEKPERKPDVEITGVMIVDGTVRGGLHTEHAVIEMKAEERQTGHIITMDRQESAAVESTAMGAQRAAEALAVDELAARVLPLLAK
jgi:hypothetical protein